ncbi:MAG: hypothetical protein KF708_19815 [Pirellulales bacterium]|nr:hypothetical protein [Pirellulales bacterium]
MTWSRLVLIAAALLASLAVGTLATTAQQPAATDDATIAALDARAGRFLEAVSIGDTERAYLDLLAGGRLAQQKDAVAALVEKTGQLRTQYGKYQSFERVGAERIGQDLVLLTYLYKSADFPVVWKFAFYHGSASAADSLPKADAWRVISVRFDTDFDSLAHDVAATSSR